jgi:uncharacterized phage protein (TIGR01671 family)
MREIKFRAWDNTYKKMISWVDLVGFSVRGLFYDYKFNVMQFTGLHDKNGKEIYEGDIVTYLNCYTKKMLNKQIVWDKYSCGFTCDPMGHQNLWYLQEYLKDNKLDLEVSGNIYENPELLKEG